MLFANGNLWLSSQICVLYIDPNFYSSFSFGGASFIFLDVCKCLGFLLKFCKYFKGLSKGKICTDVITDKTFKMIESDTCMVILC